MRILLTILATLLSQHSLCQTAQFTPQDSETLRNLILTDSKLLLGTSGAVYRLDFALSQEQRRALGSANRLLVADSPTGTLNGTVLSCDEGTCHLLETSNLGNVKWEVPRSTVLLSGGGNAVGSFSISRNGTSDITFGEPPSSSTGRRFVKGALRNVFSTNPSEFVRYAFYGNANPNAPVDYLKDNFLLTNYTYFTIQPDSEELRVVRFCQKDPGFVNGGERNFESRFEILLTCGGTGNIFSSSATFKQTAQGPRLFVAVNRMASGSNIRSYVCAFSADQIDTLMLEKLRACVGGSGQVGIDLKVSCPSLTAALQARLTDPCILVGILRSGLEVDTPLAGSILASPVRTEQVTSLASLSLDNRLFLFTGTSSGRVHQYHVESDSGSTLVRSVTLEVGGVSVVKMLSSDNGEYIYIMTSNKLVRHTVAMCDTYTSCHACTSSLDPVCGWCVLRGLCTRQSLCSPVTDQTTIPQTIWISTTTTCPAITMATPIVIYLSELKDALGGSMVVTLTMSNVNIPQLLQFSYKCVYRFTGAPGSVTRSASRSGETFMCLQPLVSDVPQIPAGQDSVDMEVLLTVAGVELATADTALEITDCSVHNSCTACITSGVDKCRWCPFSHECIADTASQTCSGGDTLTIRYGGSCPRIMAGSYRIHVNHAYTTSPLQIATSDLSTFQAQFDRNEFECVLCEVGGCTSPLFTLPASLMNSGTRVHCEGNHYPFSLTSSQLATELRIRVTANPDRRIDNPDSVGVTLYECGLMGAHCGQCLAIGAEYSCAYCGPTQGCQLTSVCPGTGFTEVDQFDVCNAQPEIVGFSPAAGPVNGGTILTISGTNLGADVGHVFSVSVGGVTCALIAENYVPAIMIQCRTGSVGSTPSSGSIEIQIVVNGQPTTVTSEEEFQYKVPTLSDSLPQPSFGPRSGGSRITVTGGNLDIGSNHSVTVEGEECAVVSVGADGILCTTPEGSVGVGSVMVTVDGWSEEALSGFRYLEDPTFESIQPNTSFVSGGTNYTITGTNLHSVQDPHLLMYVGVVSGRGKRQIVIQEPIRLTSGTCLSEGQTTLYCPAPPVDLNGSSSTTVGFGLLLDNVAMVMTLEGTLTVYSDPIFSPIPNELVFEQSQPVTICIEGAGFLFTEDQVQVRITPCETALRYCDCAVTNITNQNSLTCEVANPIELTLDTSLTISVHVGNQSETVGTIRVATNQQLLNILIAVITVVVILSLVIVFVLVVVFRRNSRKKDQKHDQLVLMLELNRLQSSATRECKPESHIDATEGCQALMKLIPESTQIPNSQLKLASTPVGQGEFGIVYKGILTDWNKVPIQAVAVKTLKGLFNSSDVKCLVDEIVKMREFHHPHIMSLIGMCLDAGSGVSMVMPFMVNGNLLEYLKRERPSLELDDDCDMDQILSVRKLLLRMCHHIALGMAYLAEQKFIHRDLAARNCMLDSQGHIKVGDFGLAEDVYVTGYFRQKERADVKLPFKWMAIESLNDAIFTEKTDVWSYGVTVWEVFSCGWTPYPAMDPMSLIQWLREGRRLERPINAACATEISSVMRKCWRECPEERPTFSELCSLVDRLMMSTAGYTELSMVLPQPIASQLEYDYVLPVAAGTHSEVSPEPVVTSAASGTGGGVSVNTGAGAYCEATPLSNHPVVTVNAAYGVRGDVLISSTGGGTALPDDPTVTDNAAYGVRRDVQD